MTRYPTVLNDGRVYVETDDGRLAVGDVDRVVDCVGGPAWTIEYSDWERSRYDLDTSDEGLTVDVVDMMAAMTHGERFVETLAAMPETPGADGVSPRLGLFVGKLVENLQSGVS